MADPARGLPHSRSMIEISMPMVGGTALAARQIVERGYRVRRFKDVWPEMSLGSHTDPKQAIL